MFAYRKLINSVYIKTTFSLQTAYYCSIICNAEPLISYGHPFYVDCEEGNIYHAHNEKIEYQTKSGNVRIRHKDINNNKSILKRELIYKHYHKQLELDRHLKIIHINNDYTNHKISNLTTDVRTSCIDKETGTILKLPKITDLSGFETLNGYPLYLINVESGIIIDKDTQYSPYHFLGIGGYIYAQLELNGIRNSRRAHRVIYEHVHGTIPKGYQIDHKNDSRRDNSINNLQMLSAKQHTAKTMEDGKKFIPTGADRKPMVAINIDTQDKIQFRSINQASKYLGTHTANIGQICKGNSCRIKAWSTKMNAWFTFKLL
eukprot:477250_1